MQMLTPTQKAAVTALGQALSAAAAAFDTYETDGTARLADTYGQSAHIAAIKQLRATGDTGLREAKDVIDVVAAVAHRRFDVERAVDSIMAMSVLTRDRAMRRLKELGVYA